MRKRAVYQIGMAVVFFTVMAVGVQSVIAGVLLQRQRLGKTVAIIPSPAGRELWVATTTGLHIIATAATDGGAQTYTVLRDPVISFASGSDGVWLTTDRECDFVSWTSRRVVPAMGVSGRIVAVQSTAKDTFLFTTSGIFLTNRDATRAVSRISGEGTFTWGDVVTIGDTVYAADGSSLYRVTSIAATPTPIGSSIVRLTAVDNTLFLGTRSGLFRVDQSSPNVSVQIIDKPVNDMRANGGMLFVATDTKTYATPKGVTPFQELMRQGDQPHSVPVGGSSRIWTYGNFTILLADGPPPNLFSVYSAVRNSVTQPAAAPLNLPSSNIQDVVVSNVDSLANSDAVAPSSATDGGQTVDKRNISLSFSGPKIYVATQTGLYVRELPQADWTQACRRVSLTHVAIAGETVWVTGDDFVAEYRPDVAIDVDVQLVESSMVQSVVNSLFQLVGVRLSGAVRPVVRYVGRLGKDETVPPIQELVLADSKKHTTRFDMKREHGEYAVADPLTTLRFTLKDEWGNEAAGPIQGTFFWRGAVSGFALVVLWLLALLALVVFAPVSVFMNAVLMNHYVRKYGFLNIIPALALFDPVRRHLLRRYLASLRAEVAGDPPYILPAAALDPVSVFMKLAARRSVYVYGESGIGKTAFARRLLRFALDDAPFFIPIFISLRQQGGARPAEAFSAQLQSYGSVTDDDLAQELLKHGSFVFLIDGLNEVSNEMRASVSEFIGRYKGTSRFLLTSQEDFTEFEGVRLRIDRLTPERIRTFLSTRLPPSKLTIVKNLDAVSVKILSVPQELLLYVRIVERGEDINPRSRLELYERASEPARRYLDDIGQKHIWTILAERSARAIMGGSRVDFAHEIYNDVRQPLVDAGFVVQRRGEYVYRHEQMQGYVAGTYFATKWRQIFGVQTPAPIIAGTSEGTGAGATPKLQLKSEAVSPEYAWLPMLRFAALMLDSPERENYLSEIARFDDLLAAEVRQTVLETGQQPQSPLPTANS